MNSAWFENETESTQAATNNYFHTTIIIIIIEFSSERFDRFRQTTPPPSEREKNIESQLVAMKKENDLLKQALDRAVYGVQKETEDDMDFGRE